MSGLAATLISAIRDVLPVALVLFGFQYLVLRRPFPRATRVAAGFVLMLIGLTLLLLGLEKAVFPLGESLTRQLFDLAAGFSGDSGAAAWPVFFCVGSFAAAVTFAAVFAEPVLTALADRAQKVSGSTINALRMRLVVALGAAGGTALGVLKILWGGHIGLILAPVVLLIWLQSRYAPPVIRPLAYDAGVAGISTIMVPLLVSIGTVLAMAIPGRSVLADGFGLVVLAALMPVAAVMLYAQLASRIAQRRDES